MCEERIYTGDYRFIDKEGEYIATLIMRAREKKNYSLEFKMHVVELYLTTEVSYRELALSLGINNPPMIAKWVTDYRAVGADALRPVSYTHLDVYKRQIAAFAISAFAIATVITIRPT